MPQAGATRRSTAWCTPSLRCASVSSGSGWTLTRWPPPSRSRLKCAVNPQHQRQLRPRLHRAGCRSTQEAHGYDPGKTDAREVPRSGDRRTGGAQRHLWRAHLDHGRSESDSRRPQGMGASGGRRGCRRPGRPDGICTGDIRMKNLIDRIIEPFSPAAVVSRLAAREAIRAYEAARPSRTHKAKGEPHSADLAVQLAGKTLREQARYLDENHDLVTGLFDRLEERVVGGAGIGVEPIPLTLVGDVHLDFAAQIKEGWSEWSLRPEASGELTRPQMERLVCRTWLRDGEALAQKLRGRIANYTHLTRIPFALELLEPDYLPFDYNDITKGILQGIERDAWRRVRAYHLYKQHPGDMQGFWLDSTNTKRVEADRIIHIAHRKRIGQSRGVPLLHAVLIRLA